MAEQRQVIVVTSLGKKFKGKMDIPNATLRTTDLFNSGSIFWRDPSEKCFENAILLHDVQMTIDDSAVNVKFDKIQVKLSEIILFYDDLKSISDEKEKMRAESMLQKAKEHQQIINIITTEISQSFYHLTGLFYGLFKKKSNDKFIPLTGVKLVEIYKKEGKWFQKEVELPYKFIGISTKHIEAVRTSEGQVLKIPPGAQLPLHTHPVINAGVLLSGKLPCT